MSAILDRLGVELVRDRRGRRRRGRRYGAASAAASASPARPARLRVGVARRRDRDRCATWRQPAASRPSSRSKPPVSAIATRGLSAAVGDVADAGLAVLLQRSRLRSTTPRSASSSARRRRRRRRSRRARSRARGRAGRRRGCRARCVCIWRASFSAPLCTAMVEHALPCVVDVVRRRDAATRGWRRACAGGSRRAVRGPAQRRSRRATPSATSCSLPRSPLRDSRCRFHVHDSLSLLASTSVTM